MTSQNSSTPTWWELLLYTTQENADTETLGMLLMEGGAEVVNHLSTTELQVFVPEAEKEIVLSIAQDHLLTLERQKPVEETNWIQTCEELLEPQVLGELHIIPVKNVTTTVDLTVPANIYIIPGTGFGTGHHESTKNPLLLLQHPRLVSGKPLRVLDMGIGSGILSIAAVKLYGSTAYGTDIDPLALDNARENIRLNGVEKEIELVQEELPQKGSFDLIMANIYAEVLCRNETYFHSLLNAHGHLIMSGIMPSLLGDVKESYSEERWELHLQLDKGEWCSLLLSKK